MSIVGTRPPLISETNLYEPRHKARLVLSDSNSLEGSTPGFRCYLSTLKTVV